MFKTIIGVGSLSIGGVIGIYLGNKYNANKNIWVETYRNQNCVLALKLLEIRKYNIEYIVFGDTKIGDTIVERDNSRINFNLPIKYIKPESGLFKSDYVGEKLIENAEYMNELKKYINMGNKKMVILKKPSELFESYLRNKEETKKLMGNIECYLYSFTIDVLLIDGYNRDDINDFVNSFKTVYIFDTDNILGKNYKLCGEKIKNNEMYYKKILNLDDFFTLKGFYKDLGFKELIDDGNVIINIENKELGAGNKFELKELCSYEELAENIKLNMIDEDKDLYKRLYVHYVNRLFYYEYSILCGAMGLALCMDNKEYFKYRVRMNINENYEKVFTKDDKSNIYTVLNEEHIVSSVNNNVKDKLLEDLTILVN